MERPDLDSEEGLVVADLEGLDHVVDHCSHYVVGMAQLHGSRLVHPEFRFCRLEEHHHHVGVAAHIRIEDAAAGRSSQEEVRGEEAGEGSCTVLTFLVEEVRCRGSRR